MSSVREPIVVSDGSETENSDVEEIKPLPVKKRVKIPLIKQSLSDLSQRFLSTSPQRKKPKLSQQAEVKNEVWYNKYAPVDIEDVAIHKKKLVDLSAAMQSQLQSGQPRVLVLSGPAGCSKSTTVKILANKLAHSTSLSHKPYIEWITPTELYGSSSINHFSDFLSSVRYTKSFIIIEDLPHVYHDQTKLDFQKALLSWLCTGENVPPIIVCLSECETHSDKHGFSIETSFVAETVLGRNVLNHPLTQRIKFNPVNKTLLSKVLKSIVQAEPVFRSIPVGQTNKIVQELSSIGDLRAAISSLQFWSLHPDRNWTTYHDSTPSIFHSIGKVLYGTESGPPQDNNLLKLGVLENYSAYSKGKLPLKTAASITESLSVADTLARDEFSLASVTHELSLVEKHLHGSTIFPREYKVINKMRKIKQDIQVYQLQSFKHGRHVRETSDSILQYGFYEAIINKERKFKERARRSYLGLGPVSSQWQLEHRLGGDLTAVRGDGDIVPYEESTESLRMPIVESSDEDDFADDPIVDSDDGTEEIETDDELDNW